MRYWLIDASLDWKTESSGYEKVVDIGSLEPIEKPPAVPWRKLI